MRPEQKYKKDSKREVAKRFWELQEAKKKLWDIYALKAEVVDNYRGYQEIWYEGIKCEKFPDKDVEFIYTTIDTSHDEYKEMNLLYVLNLLIQDALTLKDYDEAKSIKARQAIRND